MFKNEHLRDAGLPARPVPAERDGLPRLRPRARGGPGAHVRAAGARLSTRRRHRALAGASRSRLPPLAVRPGRPRATALRAAVAAPQARFRAGVAAVTRSLLVLERDPRCVAIAGLVWLDRGFESRREDARVAASAFHAIADAATPEVASIRRIELKLPGSDTAWVAERKKGGWRLPTYRGVYALPEAVDGLPEVAARGARDRRRKPRPRCRAVRTRARPDPRRAPLRRDGLPRAPVARGRRRSRPARGRVLRGRRGRGPRAPARHEPVGDGAPRSVEPVPSVHGHARDPGRARPPDARDDLVLGARGAGNRPLVRRDTPMEEMQRTMGKGPRYQWFATTPEGERRLNDDGGRRLSQWIPDARVR